MLDSDGVYKAAAFELRRLFAPALLSLVVRDGHASLVVVLDNARESVTGDAVLEACSLIDGRELGRWEARVTVLPGERRVALEVDLRAFVAEETLLFATFDGTSSFRLLSEPKDARLPTPRLTAARTAAGIAITSDVPVVDLFVRDPEDKARFTDNFVTLPRGGTVTLRTDGAPAALEARSLAGVHKLSLPQR